MHIVLIDSRGSGDIAQKVFFNFTGVTHLPTDVTTETFTTAEDLYNILVGKDLSDDLKNKLLVLDDGVFIQEMVDRWFETITNTTGITF